MRLRQRTTESGQAQAEYAVLVAIIALFCIVALLFLGLAVSERFRATGEPEPEAPLRPPNRAGLVYPRTVEECEDGGWRNFVQFESEDACREYVESLTP